MTELYKNKYRIPSARLQLWDYASPAAYFLTICSHNRVCCFGEIIRSKIILSDAGMIAHQYWQEISDHFNHVELGPFIVMPNHIHGIIILKDLSRDAIDRVSNKAQEIENESIDRVSNKAQEIENESIDRVSSKVAEIKNDSPGTKRINNNMTNHSAKIKRSDTMSQLDLINHVSTGGGITGDKNPMLNNSISKIILWYKGKCTFQIRKSNPDVYFQWQSRFYDHIIRDEQDYLRISEYIVNNPVQWEDDKYFSKW